MILVGFSLGSNLGDKIGKIRAALDLLDAHSGMKIDLASSFYETEPWGVKNQDPFVNICAVGQTSLKPHELLSYTQSVENQLGRSKTTRWGPRIIDVDILFFGDQSVDFHDLTIPHKSMMERAFVLVPLREILPDFTIANQSIDELLVPLRGDADGIVTLPDSPWLPGNNANIGHISG